MNSVTTIDQLKEMIRIRLKPNRNVSRMDKINNII